MELYERKDKVKYDTFLRILKGRYEWLKGYEWIKQHALDGDIDCSDESDY